VRPDDSHIEDVEAICFIVRRHLGADDLADAPFDEVIIDRQRLERESASKPLDDHRMHTFVLRGEAVIRLHGEIRGRPQAGVVQDLHNALQNALAKSFQALGREKIRDDIPSVRPRRTGGQVVILRQQRPRLAVHDLAFDASHDRRVIEAVGKFHGQSRNTASIRASTSSGIVPSAARQL